MAKNNQKKNANKKSNKKEKVSLREYFRGVRSEMKKVVWPTKEELGAYTVVVIGTCAVFALGFWLIDTGVIVALKSVLGVTMN